MQQKQNNTREETLEMKLYDMPFVDVIKLIHFPGIGTEAFSFEQH